MRVVVPSGTRSIGRLLPTDKCRRCCALAGLLSRVDTLAFRDAVDYEFRWVDGGRYLFRFIITNEQRIVDHGRVVSAGTWEQIVPRDLV